MISTTFTSALETYASLLQHSPNLSEQVMIEAIKKEYELPSVLLTQILTSNPQAAKSEDIKQALSDRLVPLDDWQKEQIDLGLTWVSRKEELEAIMDEQLYIRNSANVNLINDIIESEQIQDKQSAILELLDVNGFLHDRLVQASMLRSGGDLDGAVGLLDATSSAFNLKEGELLEITTLGHLWELESELVTLDNPVLSEEQMDDLYNIYFGMGNVTGAKAMEILVVYGEFDYEPYLLSEPELRNTFSPTNTNDSFGSISIFPNPGADFSILKLGKPAYSPLTIKLLDITGRIMDTWSMEPGQTELLIPLEHLSPQMLSVAVFEASGSLKCTLPLVKQP